LAHCDARPIDGPDEDGSQDALVVASLGVWRSLGCRGGGRGFDEGKEANHEALCLAGLDVRTGQSVWEEVQGWEEYLTDVVGFECSGICLILASKARLRLKED
jgi:hypothetical protein